MRSQTDKRIAGVCGGLADYFDVDPTIVRVSWGDPVDHLPALSCVRHRRVCGGVVDHPGSEGRHAAHIAVDDVTPPLAHALATAVVVLHVAFVSVSSSSAASGYCDGPRLPTPSCRRRLGYLC
jgi:hypothetical protein